MLRKLLKVEDTRGHTINISLSKAAQSGRDGRMSVPQKTTLQALEILFPHFDIYSEVYIDGVFFDFLIPLLNIAIETDGRQHDEYIQHFHKNAAGFGRSKRNDSKKEALCEINSWKLIRIKAEDVRDVSSVIGLIRGGLNV
jgi:very-short-patch-repair endonuclease